LSRYISELTSLVGINPLATITALAERSVALVAEERGMEIDLETTNGDIDAYSQRRVSHSDSSRTETNRDYVSTGWHFTESLEGHVAVPSSCASYAVAEREGKGCSSTMSILLTVEIYRRVEGMFDDVESTRLIFAQGAPDQGTRDSAPEQFHAVPYHAGQCALCVEIWISSSQAMTEPQRP
jgi:hypothetical protein